MTVLTVGAAGAGGAYDYTCDGTDDHAEINAAIAAAGSGDTVLLSAGEFVCGAHVPLTTGVSLAGAGPAETVLRFEYLGTRRVLGLYGSQVLDGIGITGNAEVQVQGSAVTVSDVAARDILASQAFSIYAAGATLTDIVFDHCDAIDAAGYGFNLTGYGELSRLEDVTVSDCSAIRCGVAGAGDVYWCGFAVQGTGETFVRVRFVDCYAEENWYDGFHVDDGAGWYDCAMTRCTSVRNGLVRPFVATYDPDIYPTTGFFVKDGWTLTDCISDGNRTGFSVYWGIADLNQPANLIRCSAIDPVYDAFHLYSHTATTTLSDCIADGVMAPNRYLCVYSWQYRIPSGHVVSDLRLLNNAGTFAEVNGATGTTITYYLEPFTVETAAPVTGETVAFTETSENDGLTAWTWDFGDGSGSAAQHPTHVYTAPGAYPVTLTAGGNTVSREVVVAPDPREHVCRYLREKRARQARGR